MKLTDTFIRRVSGNGKVQKHSDGGGLYLYVTPTGKKSGEEYIICHHLIEFTE